MANKEDQTDWSILPSRKPKPSKDEKPEDELEEDSFEICPKLDPNSDFYEICNGKKGKAIIFNHYQFDNNYSTRSGTDKDAQDLQKQLEKFNFDVTVYKDLKYGELFNTLEETSKCEKLQNYSCILIAVMSHGEKNKVMAKDHYYNPENLWIPFCGSRCPSLIGKPKIVLIQACRGSYVDEGAKYKKVNKDSSTDFKIPNMADLLIMYSTFEDHYSFRSPLHGSWFVQALVSELGKRGKKEDFLSILTCVNRKMAYEYESFVMSTPELDKKKQIGTIVSTLTKKYYLFEENTKISKEADTKE